jgi:single-stranded DNA-binding protein
MQKDAKSLIYMHFLAWGKLAEEMFEKLKVGSHVLLNGEVNITTRGDDKLTIHLDSFVDLREFNNIDSATIYFKSSNTQKSRAKASHNDFLCDRERENIIKNIASNKQNRQNHDEYADIDF